MHDLLVFNSIRHVGDGEAQRGASLHNRSTAPVATYQIVRP